MHPARDDDHNGNDADRQITALCGRGKDDVRQNGNQHERRENERERIEKCPRQSAEHSCIALGTVDVCTVLCTASENLFFRQPALTRSEPRTHALGGHCRRFFHARRRRVRAFELFLLLRGRLVLRLLLCRRACGLLQILHLRRYGKICLLFGCKQRFFEFFHYTTSFDATR